jgi:hypothetical protein
VLGVTCVLGWGSRRFENGVHRVSVRFRGRIGFYQRVTDVLGDRLPRAVEAAVLDPAAELGHRGLRRVEGHVRGLRDRIRIDPDDPGTATQDSFNDGFLGSEEHPAHVEHGGCDLAIHTVSVMRPGSSRSVLLRVSPEAIKA